MIQTTRLFNERIHKISATSRSLLDRFFTFREESLIPDEPESVPCHENISTGEMVDLMRYAIRFNERRVKDGCFKIKENSFDVIIEHPDWEYMVRAGYAKKSETIDGVIYRLSMPGILFLSEQLKVNLAIDY